MPSSVALGGSGQTGVSEVHSEVQSGSVFATQCPAVITIREVSSDPPQNWRLWALPEALAGEMTTAACQG